MARKAKVEDKEDFVLVYWKDGALVSEPVGSFEAAVAYGQQMEWALAMHQVGVVSPLAMKAWIPAWPSMTFDDVARLVLLAHACQLADLPKLVGTYPLYAHEPAPVKGADEPVKR